MKKSCFFALLLPFAAACISFISDASANAEIRDWKLTDGSEFRGEIDEVDEVAQTVKLKNDKGGAAVIPLDELSTLDRAWVLQWIEFAEELAEAAEKFGGRIEHYDGKGETEATPFHVYHPSGDIPAGTARPLTCMLKRPLETPVLEGTNRTDSVQLLLGAIEKGGSPQEPVSTANPGLVSRAVTKADTMPLLERTTVAGAD